MKAIHRQGLIFSGITPEIQENMKLKKNIVTMLKLFLKRFHTKEAPTYYATTINRGVGQRFVTHNKIFCDIFGARKSPKKIVSWKVDAS